MQISSLSNANPSDLSIAGSKKSTGFTKRFRPFVSRKMSCSIRGMNSPNGETQSTISSAGATEKGSSCMSDLEHARLMLQLAQDDLTALEELKASQRISQAIFGLHA